LTINDCTLAENNAVAAYNYGYFGYDGCGGALYNAGDAVLNRCLVCSNNVAGGYSFHNWDFPTSAAMRSAADFQHRLLAAPIAPSPPTARSAAVARRHCL